MTKDMKGGYNVPVLYYTATTSGCESCRQDLKITPYYNGEVDPCRREGLDRDTKV